MKKNIFISDFDGTIISKDIAELILYDSRGKEYCDELCSKINLGSIGISEFMINVCECLQDKKIFNYVDYIIEKYGIEIDKNFINLNNLCNKNDVELKILSGGFKKIIEYILTKNNIKIDSDKIIAHDFEIINKNVKFIVNEDICPKGNYIEKNIYDDKEIIFSGDGVSDFSVVEFCSEIYVKRNSVLNNYCEKKNIKNYMVFDNFSNVIENLIEKKILFL